jgi:hypothetical protein
MNITADTPTRDNSALRAYRSRGRTRDLGYGVEPAYDSGPEQVRPRLAPASGWRLADVFIPDLERQRLAKRDSSNGRSWAGSAGVAFVGSVTVAPNPLVDGGPLSRIRYSRRIVAIKRFVFPLFQIVRLPLLRADGLERGHYSVVSQRAD